MTYHSRERCETSGPEPEDLELTQVRRLILVWAEGLVYIVSGSMILPDMPKINGTILKQKLNLDSPGFKALLVENQCLFWPFCHSGFTKCGWSLQK